MNVPVPPALHKFISLSALIFARLIYGLARHVLAHLVQNACCVNSLSRIGAVQRRYLVGLELQRKSRNILDQGINTDNDQLGIGVYK